MDAVEVYGSTIDLAINFWNSFYDSNFFAVVKFILVIYVTVLLVDIVLLLILRGVSGDIRQNFLGMKINIGSKDKNKTKWDAIKRRLESGSSSQYKAAILEADKMADKILTGIGYKGSNMAQRLESVQPGQIDNLEDLKKAHETRNQIIYKKDYAVSLDEARRLVRVYEEFLKDFEAL